MKFANRVNALPIFSSVSLAGCYPEETSLLAETTVEHWRMGPLTLACFPEHPQVHTYPPKEQVDAMGNSCRNMALWLIDGKLLFGTLVSKEPSFTLSSNL